MDAVQSINVDPLGITALQNRRKTPTARNTDQGSRITSKSNQADRTDNGIPTSPNPLEGLAYELLELDSELHLSKVQPRI